MCRSALFASLLLCGVIGQDSVAQCCRTRCASPCYTATWQSSGCYRLYGGWSSQCYPGCPTARSCWREDQDFHAEAQAAPMRRLQPPVAPPVVAKKVEVPVVPPSLPAPAPAAPSQAKSRTAMSPIPVPLRSKLDIKTQLQAQGEFGELLKAATTANVSELLDNPGPFTVFAPTDEAFRRLEPGLLSRLLAAPEKLKEVLLYHALAEKLAAAEAQKQGAKKSVLGPDLRFRSEGASILVNDARIVRSDVECMNGVLHSIDKVLFPPGFKFADAAPSPKKSEPSPSAAGKAAAKPAPKGP
jgi:uncharacterized surface protein with fasciclin (FAS1) repeats